MAVVATTNSFFGRPKGMIVDNSYDPFVLKSLIERHQEEIIEYLFFQDHDLGCLQYFGNVHFLSIPQEATNFSLLNEMSELYGLGLFSSSLKRVAPSILKKLQYLEIFFDEKENVDISAFPSLKRLRMVGAPHREIRGIGNLELLELNNCKNIMNLGFLENHQRIKALHLYDLPQLENVCGLEKTGRDIERLSIVECRRIQNIEEALSGLINIKHMQLITKTTSPKMKLSSLAFLERLRELEVFETNYKIENGNLHPLLRLKEANITAFYPNYSLRDKELPHISVPIYLNGTIKRVELEQLELGKDDPRIQWI